MSTPQTIHIVMAEHYSVPGLVMRLYTDKDRAVAEAVELTNLILKDFCEIREEDYTPATADTWEAALESVPESFGDANCYVCIREETLQ
jgi:hypothetical protein